MIFYVNLFKAIKFALKVIDINRLARNLQLGLGTNMRLYRYVTRTNVPFFDH